ncbi:MAG: T9SS type A sorting domain-containing protein [Ignavibacteriales bacterium]|nr:T9SS type A sorting domain-containing protein [Ignavibacteriales bacterium]
MKKLIVIICLIITNAIFSQITFESDFESGNLSSFEVIDSTSFYVTSIADNGVDGGSTRWIYFRINSVKNKEIKVLFTNSDVTKAMYSYDNKNFIRFTDEETPSNGIFFKRFDHDTVYVAYYAPYTYSHLQNRIAEWTKNSLVKLDTLGFSPKGLPIQELTITDKSIPDSLKKSIWIHARTHCSETPSSWQFDGIMDELTSNKEVINSYLKETVFHMIPFTTPDGVYYGRSRTNYEGINLETNWDKSDSFTSGEVKILKARMKELGDENPFSVFLNLHSQASSYCTFWIHNASSTSEDFYRREYQFGNLNISDNPYFVRSDFSESSLKAIYPEGWLWNNYGPKVMALTYETPYDNYFRSSSEPYIEVTNENLAEIGKRTVYAIAEYLEISNPQRYLLDNASADIVGNYTNYDDFGNEFYSKDFTALEQGDGNNYAVFNTENLPSGSYQVDVWWATSTGNSFETKFEITAGNNLYAETKTQKLNGGQWNYLTNVELNNEGIISIKVKSNNTGIVVADAFRLIYVGPVTSVKENTIPNEFVLEQNYPNPFNPTTTIKYTIPSITKGKIAEQQNVELKIYDVLGREIKTLVDEIQASGTYEVQFNANALASGTYFYRLQVGDYSEIKKMIFLK